MFIIRAYFVVLTVLMISFLTFGCSKDDAKDTTPRYTYNISGSVVDENGAAISGAVIKYVSGSMSDQTTTDANGDYRFTDLEIGTYSIEATKSSFTFGSTTAEITTNGAMVSDITLKSLAVIANRVEEVVTTDVIQTSGASIVSEVDANVSTGSGTTETTTNTVSATLAPETVITINDVVQTGDVSLAVTPMKINDVPPPPEDEMPLGAAIFEPVDAKFDKPVEVKVPVGIKLPAGTEIPLKKFEGGEWIEIGTATIDESGLGADADVTEFGQIAIQPEMSVEIVSSEPLVTEGETTQIPEGQTVVEIEFITTVEITDLPEGITEEYALSLFEKMLGIPIGVSRMVKFELPSVSKTVAKAASPLSPKTAGEFAFTKTTSLLKIMVGTATVTGDFIAGGTPGHLIVGGVSAKIYSVGGEIAAAGTTSHDQGSI
ncbi:carboxypeptidase-like regulatory domain-containing protein [Candidatus Latescibacterota bacterium]